jgi:sugar lactone lactonase YvrE
MLELLQREPELDEAVSSKQSPVLMHEAAGPIRALAYDPRARRVAFCCVEGGWLHELSPPGTVRSFQSGFSYASALRYDCEGRLVALATGEHAVMRDGESLGSFDGLAGLATHSSGMMYLSTASKLQLMNGENKSVIVASDAVPDGGALCYDPEEKYLFIAEPARRRVMRMTIQASGKLEYRCMFAELPAGVGSLGEIVWSAHGELYCASDKGVYVFDRGGKWLGVVAPQMRCASLCLGDGGLVVAEAGRIWTIHVS